MQTTTSNKALIAAFKTISEIRIARNELIDQEKDLNAFIRKTMKEMDTKVLIAGEFIGVITDCTKNNIDMKKVKILLADQYETCVQKIEYQTLEIKKA